MTDAAAVLGRFDDAEQRPVHALGLAAVADLFDGGDREHLVGLHPLRHRRQAAALQRERDVVAGPPVQGADHAEVAHHQPGGAAGDEQAVCRGVGADDRTDQAGGPVVLPGLEDVLAVDVVDEHELRLAAGQLLRPVEPLVQPRLQNSLQEGVGGRGRVAKVHDLDDGKRPERRLETVAQRLPEVVAEVIRELPVPGDPQGDAELVRLGKLGIQALRPATDVKPRRNTRAATARDMTALRKTGQARKRSRSSKNPGYVFATQPGLRITTPGTFSPTSARLIAMRWSL